MCAEGRAGWPQNNRKRQILKQHPREQHHGSSLVLIPVSQAVSKLAMEERAAASGVPVEWVRPCCGGRRPEVTLARATERLIHPPPSSYLLPE